MSLADLIPAQKSGLDAARIFNVMWLGPIVFTCCILTIIILQRLGLPMSVTLGLASAWFVGAVIAVAVIGRTMTGSSFFYCGHLPSSGIVGLGGTFDWVGGAFLMLYFSSTALGRMVIAPSLMLGLLLQACLFAMAIQRSGAITAPGFFSWRVGTQLAGPLVMLIVGVILALICVAEFSVAKMAFVNLTQFSPHTAAWIILAFAVLPSITGGAMGLIMVNGVLAGCFLISVLMPASVIGFIPSLIRQRAEVIQPDVALAPLQAESANITAFGNDTSSISLLLTVFVLSAGFSVLPQALARLSYNSRPVPAIESVGWTAMICFLAIASLPLSLGLVGVVPTSAKLAVLLRSHDALHVLPYVGLLFAAFNALAITLYALSSSIVRAMRRSRNLDPGEQSMFSVRLLIVAIAAFLYFIPEGVTPPPAQLFVWALCLGAAGLFMPLVACIWFSLIPRTSLVLAVPIGAGVAMLGFLVPVTGLSLSPIEAGGLGMGASFLILIIGRLVLMMRRQNQLDPRLSALRQPDMNS